MGWAGTATWPSKPEHPVSQGGRLGFQRWEVDFQAGFSLQAAISPPRTMRTSPPIRRTVDDGRDPLGAVRIGPDSMLETAFVPDGWVVVVTVPTVSS